MVLQQTFHTIHAHLTPYITTTNSRLTTFFSTPLPIVFLFVGTFLTIVLRQLIRDASDAPPVPISVNYHFHRLCNKSCGFCFYTAKTSFTLHDADAKRGLRMLKAAGTRKVNFAGGEPFLNQRFLASMLVYAKRDLCFESVSIVSNGSLVKRSFLQRYAGCIDILAISCDSFDEATNVAIGRGSGTQVEQLRRIAGWCKEFGIKFKINSVICSLNHAQDMNAEIERLQPFRWKAFQVHQVPGENDDSEGALKDVRQWAVTDEQFEAFVERHRGQKCLVPEPVRLMKASYLILDEYMRFLNRHTGEPSESILDVGVEQALRQVEWDREAFVERGGIYDWGREANGSSTINCNTSGDDDDGCATKARELEW